jgi:hypothetical protein
MRSKKTPFALAVLAVLLGSPALAQDFVAVGSATGFPGTIVTIDLYVRDASGTLLGIDQPPNSRIQALNVLLSWPAGIGTVTAISRSGICGGLTPLYETTVPAATYAAYIVSYAESTNLVPFVLNSGLPGNKVATISFAIASGAVPNTYPISIGTSPFVTDIVNQAGKVVEDSGTPGPSTLTLINGALTVTCTAENVAPLVTPPGPITVTQTICQ